MPLPDHPPIEHFNYDETEVACRCRLCDGYRQARFRYETAKLEPTKHARFCRCELCKERRSLLLDFLAASNRREVYSELSFVMAYGPTRHRLAGECLDWVYSRVVDPGFRDLTWWALQGAQRPLHTWIEDFETAWNMRARPAVSGAA